MRYDRSRLPGTGSIYRRYGKWLAYTPKIHGKGGKLVGSFERYDDADKALRLWREKAAEAQP